MSGNNRSKEQLAAERQRQQALAALATNEGRQRIEMLMEFSPDIIYELDADGNIVFISKAVEKLGWRADELIGKSISTIIHPSVRDAAQGRYREMRTGERATRNMQMRLVARGGDARDFDVNAVAVSLSARGVWTVPDDEIKRTDKRFLGTLGIARDDTVRRRAEEVLQSAHDELEIRVQERTAELVEANKALEADIEERKRAEEERKLLQEQLFVSQKMDAIGKLAGGVAHDFNNRLTIIKGCCELLQRSTLEDAEQRADIKQIQKATDGAAALTRQLLLFSRRQRSELVPLDMVELLSSMEKMLRRLIGEHIELTTSPAPDTRLVYADPGQMEQTVMNLVINARDAMPEGGRISIRTRNLRARDQDMVCLSIQDTGTGIQEDVIDHIFEPFFTTKGPGQGTGLGLSVVYGIVDLHRGWIDVSSEVGHGTTFDVCVPICTGKEKAEREIGTAPDTSPGKGHKILYVEDEEDLRNVFARALRTFGFNVTDTGSCREAAGIFRHEKGAFDLVLSDVVLPDGNGVDLVGEMRTECPNTRILLTSGYTDQQSGIDQIQENGYPFIQKPYDLAHLINRINKVLAGHEEGKNNPCR